MTLTASMIELRSGRYLDLADPDPDAITLDVAHGLAHTCRYAGQCERFYSVAEHTTLVAARLQAQGAGPLVVLAGLHHDDAEAFLGDVTRPLKGLLAAYGDLEAQMQDAIARALELPDPGGGAASAIAAADKWALGLEAWQLMRSRGVAWSSSGLYRPDRDGPGARLGITAAQAKARYLQADYALAARWAQRQAA